MDELRKKLNELMLSESSPRLFIVDYFDAIRNQIDIECENYLSKHGHTDEKREKSIRQQEEMIKEIDLFQKECLSNLESVESSPTAIENLRNKIERLETNDQNAISRAEYEIDIALDQRKKSLLMEQGIVFLDKKYNQITENDQLILFGALIMVKDEYLPFMKITK